MKSRIFLPATKAFTLIELMIVIAVVAILATIAIPSYTSYTQKAAISELLTASASYKSDVEICIYNLGEATGCGAGKNGVQADKTTSDEVKYLKSIAVVNGKISVAGKGTLDGVSYTLTPTVNKANNLISNISWKASCTSGEALFPAGFCSADSSSSSTNNNPPQ